MVDEDLLAAVLEVGMGVVSPGAPPTPGGCLLLGDADHDHAEAPLSGCARKVGPGDLLLALALPEAHDRDVVLFGVALDVGDVRAADPPQHRRRGDVKAPVDHEPAQQPLAHELRDVALQEDAIDRTHLQAHVVGE